MWKKYLGWVLGQERGVGQNGVIQLGYIRDEFLERQLGGYLGEVGMKLYSFKSMSIVFDF